MQLRQVIHYGDEDGFYGGECPSLPSCVTQDATKEETLQNIREAIRGYIPVLEEDKMRVLKNKEVPVKSGNCPENVICRYFMSIS